MTTSNINETTVAPAQGAPPDELMLAFKQLEAEIQAVPDRDLLAVNLDVPSSVATALGAWPEIAQLRSEMLGIPGFDAARFDKLRSYALALGHAHAVYRAAVGPRDGIVELAEQLAQLREVLHADATALAKRGLLAQESVAKLRSGLGYKNLAFDVVSLVSLFRERWPTIAGKTAVEPGELDSAAQLAQKLITAVGLKEQSPTGAPEAARTRQKAFTLFANSYDEVRRLVLFLRWHQGDADTIAPSLYAGRGGRGTASEAEPATPPATDGVTAPADGATAPTVGATKPEMPAGSSPFMT